MWLYQTTSNASSRSLACAFALLLAASNVAAQIDSGPRNVDARIEFNRGVEFAPAAEQLQAIEALQTSLPSLTADFDRATGVVRSLRNRGGYLTRANPGADAVSIAIGFVGANLDVLGLDEADLAGREISDFVQSSRTGATHIYFRQTHGGVPLYNGQLQVNVNRDGRILSVHNAFMPHLAASVNSMRPEVDGVDAIVGAIADAGTPGKASKPVLKWLPIRRGQARLVWNFQLETEDGQHHYDYTVDAVDGNVWTRFDWVSDGDYRVYEAPIESPIHTSPLPPSDARTLQLAPENATASPLGWHDDGTTQYTITRGNNAHAYPDRDGNNLPDFDVDCGVSMSCDFPIDLTMNPPAYVDAAVANLFYWNNHIHDTQYLYGFDEAAGNFQVDNFGNGGLGGDDVRAEAQDNDLGGSNCNANFFTPADGSRPRMQMFTCANASPERDGDLDNLVIVHEYAHGISNRQVGGPSNVSCLNNFQQPGEGWSDLFGLIYTHQAGFLDTDARGVGSYLFNRPAVGGTIRTFPYSTNFAVNPDTYSSIAGRAVPHGVGSVWAEIAWEAYWELVNFHGFDPDLQNTATNAGNQRAMLYLNEGLKNTACSPTFIDARDGVLQASIDNGIEDFCLLWRGFGRRGLGEDASTSGPNSLTATDGFQIPAQCDENPSCGDGVCEFSESCDGATPGTVVCGADCLTGSGIPSCGNGICEAADGEDCTTCPADCNSRTKGKPANRFCCGAVGEGCSNEACNSDGFVCTENPATPSCCGDFVCEGIENDVNCAIDCPSLSDSGTCGLKGDSCAVASDCCSLKCKGPSGGKTCK